MEYAPINDENDNIFNNGLSYINDNLSVDNSDPCQINQKYYFKSVEIKELLIDALNNKDTLTIENEGEYKNKEIDELISKIESFEPKFMKLQEELDILSNEYNKEIKNTENNVKKLESSIIFMKSFEKEYQKNDENIKNIIDKLNDYSSIIKDNDKLLKIKEKYLSKRKELNSYIYFIQKLNKWNTSAICPICITNRIDTYCNPCGHTACGDCLNRNHMINNTSYNSNKCPICREYINELRKLFFI